MTKQSTIADVVPGAIWRVTMNNSLMAMACICICCFLCESMTSFTKL